MTSEILNIISSYLQYELLLDMKNGSLITEAEMTSNDLREGALGLLSLALQITSVVTFIIWFRRAYYNLGQFNKTKYSEEWAAGGWFVPIIWLFRPVQIMNKLWVKTNKFILNNSEKAPSSQGGAVIGIWWTLWIISSFAGNYILRTTFNADRVESLIGMTKGNILLELLGIPLAIITVVIIKQYHKKE